jgi:hypothetical protein
VREEDKYASKSGPTLYDELGQRTTEDVYQKLQFPKEGYYSESHDIGNGEDRGHEEKADLVYNMFSFQIFSIFHMLTLQ